MNIRKIIGLIVLLIVLLTAVLGITFYQKIYASNVKETQEIQISSQATFDSLSPILKPVLKNYKTFSWVAKMKKYTHRIKPGNYLFEKGMSNNDLVNMLRIGAQKPVKLSFNNQDSLEKLAGRIAAQIEADSISLLQVISDERFLTENGFEKKTALSMYIPNSYEVYWTMTPIEFRARMLNEYHKFWNENRIALAAKQNLSLLEVSILASIVQKETAYVPERKTIAGLYLNRLHNKWPLQADPTIIFALQHKNSDSPPVKRVLYQDLEIESPYNTYKNIGLPPGPIAMPDISAIDAVLNPDNHDYYYMCASVTDLGKHVFAKTLSQHNVNARKYQNWIAKQPNN